MHCYVLNGTQRCLLIPSTDLMAYMNEFYKEIVAVACEKDIAGSSSSSCPSVYYYGHG